MKRVLLLGTVAICTACTPTNINGLSGISVSNSFVVPPPPSAGFIVFLREENGRMKLYRRDMNGMTLGDEHLLQDDDKYFNNEDIRYPKITPDGRFVYYTERKSIAVGAEHDEFVVANNQGQRIWSSGMTTASCDGDLNYPEMLSYSFDNSNNKASFQIVGMCAGSGGWSEVGVTAKDIINDPAFYDSAIYLNPSAAWQSAPGNGFEFFGHQGEQAINPKPLDSSPDWVLTFGGSDQLHFQYIHQKRFVGATHPCDNPRPIYADHSSRLDAGTPSNMLSPYNGYAIKKAFAPSISSDGAYLMFNSEAHKTEPQGEELMYIDLSTDPCTEYKIVTPPPPQPGKFPKTQYVPYTSEIKSLGSGPGNEYGSFAVNQGHGYVMWRNDDPSAGGRTTLYYAQNLTDIPTRLHPGATVSETEASWFFQ